MNIDFQNSGLNPYEAEEIGKLLSRQKDGLNDLEQMWYLMDLIWDDMRCDNKELNWEYITAFYSHPVWLLNGLFIEQDPISMEHRHSIGNWMIMQEFVDIVDYGGGFCTLARLVAIKDAKINVDVYEPYPSEFGLKRIAEFDNIKFIQNLIKKYDCLVSTDVLEHVPDPLKVFSEMVGSVKEGGYLVIANAFFPMIKCHLPRTFHLRYSFPFFAKLIGLKKIGLLDGSHATIYQKIKTVQPNWYTIRLFELISKLVFPFLEILKKSLNFFKRISR
ncbi:class I SAM-dependent methyltransferase [Acinetobacter rongchengensis]|uniref:Methyltransferase domain-containing protein n=1 Tax=Acinetobacter rongchengensis TaxID=2419601 RepID=A0A3A8FA28_9GAMM|nr:methyltransferase domain-containing protein [Acinetobacter rongchengensis]RKG38051.1 methyltransferase domain-containing protein [Acinetobacter rongchengensis]